MKDELRRECKWEREVSEGSELGLARISKSKLGRSCIKDCEAVASEVDMKPQESGYWWDFFNVTGK